MYEIFHSGNTEVRRTKCLVRVMFMSDKGIVSAQRHFIVITSLRRRLVFDPFRCWRIIKSFVYVKMPVPLYHWETAYGFFLSLASRFYKGRILYLSSATGVGC
ncbi:hypothetical protein CEXT_442431 [Caerostris extrusa]|uniref:Uncharacterized protein n=1 Tax=Caerostris extrusa TaxID=172846 RepID=A0AAV4WZY4_CAEEX|nr:hypothetical protein CEXT_442431 [Caerostris extrusa]